MLTFLIYIWQYGVFGDKLGDQYLLKDTYDFKRDSRDCNTLSNIAKFETMDTEQFGDSSMGMPYRVQTETQQFCVNSIKNMKPVYKLSRMHFYIIDGFIDKIILW